MAKIKNYLPDNNITDKDIVIGSDGDASGVTKNFNVGTLKAHILEDVPTSIVETIVAGANITVDNTDPSNPIVSSSGGATLGLIKIVDKAGGFFTNLATASAYIRTFTNATITNESFSNGTFWFTVPNGSSFNGATYFLGHDSVAKSAYIEDTLGLITTFGNLAFKLNSGNNILGNCTFGVDAFQSSAGNNIFGNCTFGQYSFYPCSGNNVFGNCTFGQLSFQSSTGITRINNISLSSLSNFFANGSTGRFEINGTIGNTTGNDYTNFFSGSTAVIWAQKVMQTNNGGGIDGDLARAQTNGAKLFFGYADGGLSNLSYTASPTNGIVNIDTGTDATIPIADNTNAGLISPSEKSKLTGIASGAEVNVNADWNATTGDAEILNKPAIATKTSDLINDGDDGLSHFISLDDLPSNLVLYPTSTSSDIGGYSKIVTSITDPSYNTSAVDITTGAISESNQLISSLATSANIIIGNPGLFNVSTIGNIRRTAGSGTAEFYFQIYKRTSGGTETLITTSSNTSAISSTIYSQFSATALWNDGVFLATDRVVLKFYGTKVGAGSSPTYDFQFGGSNPFRTTVPIPLNVVPNINLNDINDVDITTPLNNQGLIYETSTGLWKNKTIDLSGYLTVNNPSYTGLLTGVGATQTGTSANGILNLSQTWNTTGAPSAFLMNITDTASSALSLLMNLRVNGVVRLQVTKNGLLAFGTIGTPVPVIGTAVPTTGSSLPGQTALYMGGAVGSATGYQLFFTSQSGNRSATSGTSGLVNIRETFAPISGTGTYDTLTLSPTINQTGGANGITRGLRINPVLTAAADFRAIEVEAGKIVFSSTITAPGTTGAQTINKISGKVNAAAGTTSLVVTNNLVTTNSIVMCQMGTNDATCIIKSVVEGAGSFTINYVAPTAETVIKFQVIN